MRTIRTRAVACVALFASVLAMTHAAASSAPRHEPVAFADIPGWAGDEHLPALKAFERSCTGPHPSVVEAVQLFAEETRDASAPRRAAALEPACSALLEAGGSGKFDAATARAFFEAWFEPNRVVPPDNAGGHVTAYYEPVLDGSLHEDETHRVPLFARPDDLVVFASGQRPPGFPEGLTAGKKTKDGIVAWPDRAAMEDPANRAGLEAVAWLADPVDAYFVHIQGSVRIRTSGGETLRLGFAGKNGHPYRSAGRAMIERGLVPAAGLTAEAMKDWLRVNPDIAAEILSVNPSYVFFRRIAGLADDLGPIGAEGVALTAGRSLAVDPRYTGYGTPVFISARLPTGEGMAPQPFRRLMIAQDTGSAIRGPARGDLFWGSGAVAGEIAGRINNEADFIVLKPRASAARN